MLVVCPVCGSRLIGKIGEAEYFCRACDHELELRKNRVYAYAITFDGKTKRTGIYYLSEGLPVSEQFS